MNQQLTRWVVYKLGVGGFLGMIPGTDDTVKTLFAPIWSGVASDYDTAVAVAKEKYEHPTA